MDQEQETPRARICQECGGEGHRDNAHQEVCGVCNGAGSVPGHWFWDDQGQLHTPNPPRTAAPRHPEPQSVQWAWTGERTIEIALDDGDPIRIGGTPDMGQAEIVERAREFLTDRRIGTRFLREVAIDDDLPLGEPVGFRPRRTRPEGWLAAALASGDVRDPSVPYVPEAHSPDAVVIQAPMADAYVEGSTQDGG